MAAGAGAAGAAAAGAAGTGARTGTGGSGTEKSVVGKASFTVTWSIVRVVVRGVGAGRRPAPRRVARSS